jgi:hypothetical protein
VGGERFQQLERGLAAPRVGQRSDTHDYALDIAQLRDETLDQQPREPPGGGALESLGLLGPRRPTGWSSSRTSSPSVPEHPYSIQRGTLASMARAVGTVGTRSPLDRCGAL